MPWPYVPLAIFDHKSKNMTFIARDTNRAQWERFFGRRCS